MILHLKADYNKGWDEKDISKGLKQNIKISCDVKKQKFQYYILFVLLEIMRVCKSEVISTYIAIQYNLSSLKDQRYS